MKYRAVDLTGTWIYENMMGNIALALPNDGWLLKNEFKDIHTLGDLKTIQAVRNVAHRITEENCVGFTRDILKHVLGVKGLVWIATTSNLRFVVPKSLGATTWKLRGHGIHIDSMYNLATNNKNIWIPLTDVLPNNTVELYLKQDSSLRFGGKAGLAHLFDSDIPHTTILEDSCIHTRVSLTLRYCLTRPRSREGLKCIKYRMVLI